MAGQAVRNELFVANSTDRGVAKHNLTGGFLNRKGGSKMKPVVGRTKRYPAKRVVTGKGKAVTRTQPKYLSTKGKKVTVIK